MNPAADRILPTEALLAQFVMELAEAADSGTVLDEFCRRYPDLAEHFRSQAAMIRALDDLGAMPPSEDGAAAGRAELSIPDRLGEFRIVRRITVGGMGEVYEAIQEPLGRRVALKIIRRGRQSAEAQARFLREQKILAALHQTHIVPIHTAGADDDLQFFAMPFIDGASLALCIHTLRQSGGAAGMDCTLAELVKNSASVTKMPMGSTSPNTQMRAESKPPASPHCIAPPPTTALGLTYFQSVARVLIDAAEAVQHAHDANVLHRDLKPANLMVDTAGHCWIIDFGLAGYLESEPASAARHDECVPTAEPFLSVSGIRGTPEYMAPEQWTGGVIDERTDVWGLGATMYELLTLRRPFDGPDTAAIRIRALTEAPPIPARVHGPPLDLAAICLKALNKDAARRYATAGEFAEDLRRWLRHEPTRANPAGMWRTAWLWCKRNPGWALATAASLAAVITMALAFWGYQQSRWQVAQTQTNAAQERERERQRETLLQQVQLIRLTRPHAGWSDRAWSLVSEAARVRKDMALRNQAVAVLEGIDARIVRRFRKFDASAVAFDAAGVRLLIGGAGERQGKSGVAARIWVGDGFHLSREPGAGPVAFRTDGAAVQLVADAAKRWQLRLWDVSAQKLAGEFSLLPDQQDAKPFAQATPILALSSDGRRLAGCIQSDKGISLLSVWQTNPWKLLHRVELPRKITALALSPDGLWLVGGDDEGQLTLWPLTGGDRLELPRVSRSLIHGLAFGRNPHIPAKGDASWLLAVSDAGGAVTIWDLAKRAPLAYCRGSHYDVSTVAFSPDGATLASAGRLAATLWDVATGRMLLRLQADGQDYITGLAFAPDGRRLAVSSVTVQGEEGGVVVWELDPGRGVRHYRGLVGQVSHTEISRDAKYLAALSHDWKVGLWELSTGKLLHLIEVPRGVSADNAALAFDHDARRLGFAAGQAARLWLVADGKQSDWKLPPGLTDAMAFSPDGQRLLLLRTETESGDEPFGNAVPRVLQVRDLLSKEPLRPLYTLRDFNVQTFAAVFGPQADYFVVKGAARIGDTQVRHIKAFDANSGKELWSIPGSMTRSAGLSLDPTGRILAVENSDESIAMVEPATGKLLGAWPRFPIGLAPGGRLASGPGEYPFGCSLHDRDAKDALVTLGIDRMVASVVRPFSADGKLLCWGNAEGMVTVCELAEVQRRLAQVGLGWE